MENSQKSSFTAELRRVFWPIEWHENKKFLPMAAMMFCILFNYSTLRSIKDGFVVTGIGPEAISFLKTYVVLPSAVIMMVVYAKLCNIMSPQKVFYTIAWFFSLYLVFFAFVLYPFQLLYLALHKRWFCCNRYRSGSDKFPENLCCITLSGYNDGSLC